MNSFAITQFSFFINFKTEYASTATNPNKHNCLYFPYLAFSLRNPPDTLHLVASIFSSSRIPGLPCVEGFSCDLLRKLGGEWRLRVLLCGAMSSEGKLTEGSKLKSAQLLDMVGTHLSTEAGKELKTKIGFVYQINIAPKKIGFEEESFVVDLKNLKVYGGKAEGKPDATFSFVDTDFISVATGKMNPQMAFIRGKMKIKGSMSAAQKFTPEIFPKPAKL